METSFEYVGSCTRTGQIILSSEHRAIVTSKSVRASVPVHQSKDLDAEGHCRQQRHSTVDLDALSKAYQQRKHRKTKIPEIFSPSTPLPLPLPTPSTETPPQPPPPPPRHHPQPQPRTHVVTFPHHQSKADGGGQPQWLRPLSIKYCLDQSIRQMELLGFLSLFAAVLINVPWVLLIVLLRENIQYNPATDAPR
jgi:hypothetical protein